MGENAGMFQLHATDVIGLLFQERDIIDGGGKFPERNERVLFRCPACLQQGKTPLFHQRGIVLGVQVVRIGDRAVLDSDVQEWEIPDDRSLDLVEHQVAVYVLRRHLVHDAGEYLWPKHNLKRDKQEQHQSQ